MVELRLQRGEALAIDVDVLKELAQKRFEALEAFIERTCGSATIRGGLTRGTR